MAATKIIELGHDWTAEQLRNARLRICTSLEEAEAAWRAASARCTMTAFQTYEWLLAWRDTIGRSESVSEFLVFVEGRDALVMALPLAIHRGGGVRSLQFLGGDTSDYNMALLDPAAAAAITDEDMTKLWRRIVAALPRVDVVWLRRMPRSFDEVPNPLARLSGCLDTVTTYAAHLPASYDLYAAGRSRGFIKNIRYGHRRLEKFGKVDVIAPEDNGRRTSFTRFVIDCKSRWQKSLGLSNTFARSDVAAFYHRLATTPFREGSIDVATMALDGQHLSGVWGVTFRERYILLVLTYETNFAKHSAGRLLVDRMIRSAIEGGKVRIYDFSVGDEDYKLDWTDQTSQVCELLAPRTLSGRAFASYRQARQAIKRNALLARLARRAAL